MAPQTNESKIIDGLQMGKLINQTETLINNVSSLNDSVIELRQSLNDSVNDLRQKDLLNIQQRITAIEATISNDIIKDLYNKIDLVKSLNNESERKIAEINAKRVTLAEVISVLIAIGSMIVAWFKGN